MIIHYLTKMDEIKDYINQSLKDNFMSNDEGKALNLMMSSQYLSPRKRVDLVQYAVDKASEKSNDENQQYVFKWLKKITQVLGDFGTDAEHNNAYFSHTNDLRNKVIEAIEQTNQDLSISLFTISDNAISDAICAVHERGITVRIVTDDDKVLDRGSDIYRLKHHGIPVKIDSNNSLMHHKFAVIDSLKVITGSYNWTRTASELNYENILITDNARIVDAFDKEFERLWQQMDML